MDVKTIFVVALLGLFTACSGDTGSSLGSSEDSPNGAKLYEANCTACHGPDGKAGVTGAKNLANSKLDSTKVYKLIIEGQGVMPPFEYIISSEQERNAVVDHVISLRD